MKQQEIKAFLAIAKHGSISAAAAALHYAQPTVSAYLNQLEQSLGVQLVMRVKGKRAVDLTPAGMEFLHLARQYAELDDRFARFVKEHQHGTLRLAASVVSHQYIVCHLIQKLIHIVPDVEIRLSTLEIKDMEQAMENHAFDVAICYSSPESSGVNPRHITEVPLFEEDYSILCPIDTPLPDRVLSPEELDPAFEVVHQGHGNQLIQKWRDTQGFGGAKPFFETSSILSVHTYLTDPRCWGFVLSNAALQMVAAQPEKLTIRRVSPGPMCRTCNAMILNAYPEKKVLRALLQCMDAFVSERPYLKKLAAPKGDAPTSYILQKNSADIK